MDINWKQILSDLLRRLGLIQKDFTGRIVVNISQGSVGDIEKVERIK